MPQFLIDLEPIGRRGACSGEHSILDAARQLGVDLVSLCDGKGTCGQCKVQVISGTATPLTSAERETLSQRERDAGYRLACQTLPTGDLKLRVPAESLSTPQRTQVDGLEVSCAPDPLVLAYDVILPAPALTDPRSDAERLRAALEGQTVRVDAVDVEVLRDISPRLRSLQWHAQAVVRGIECIAVAPPSTPHLGLAVDLGTTKVAGYLLELNTGRMVASKGIMNPQIAYGEDVITRIDRARSTADGASLMQRLAVGALEELARDLCAEVGAIPDQIVDAVVVGNTAMHHLLLRLPAEQLALSPYVPAESAAMDVKARDLGLPIAPGAYVHLLPNIAGYVGGDHVAMLLAIGAAQQQDIVLALDIGTNTEVCLMNHGRLASVSCASGPAFEGAHIRHGMRASAGAIERVRLDEGQITYHTIGGAPPAGLCGSGILDALAQLFLNGVVDRGGKMGTSSQIRGDGARREFVWVSEEERGGGPAITLTQSDVRELQLAKGAMRTGIQALLDVNDLHDDDIDQVIIAGAFGSYIDVSSAIAIGMLPPLPVERFRQVGNAAGTGARLALISKTQRDQAQELARRVEYVELAKAPGFSDLFSQSMYLGSYHMVAKGSA
jgi:uncharacterized 2Fe-2S/4Fe-4S cluster protein (DUF4445 family)